MTSASQFERKEYSDNIYTTKLLTKAFSQLKLLKGQKLYIVKGKSLKKLEIKEEERLDIMKVAFEGLNSYYHQKKALRQYLK